MSRPSAVATRPGPLLTSDGAHFLGTIITLNATTDAVPGSVLELIDGQQQMMTLTLLLASVYSVLKHLRPFYRLLRLKSVSDV